MCLLEITVISEDTYLWAWISGMRHGGRCLVQQVSDDVSMLSCILQESSPGKPIQHFLKEKNKTSQTWKEKNIQIILQHIKAFC